MQIVDADPEHLAGIARIYDTVVVSTAATFDLEPPPAEHWERMLESVDPSAGRTPVGRHPVPAAARLSIVAAV